MKHILFLILLAAGSAAAAQSPAAETVRKLSREKFLWLETGDTTLLKSMMAPDLQYIHSNGWIETRADVLRDVSDSTLVYHGVDVKEDKVRIHGATAILTGRGNFDVSLRGTRIQLDLLYTEVYALRGKHWVLMQRHACKY